MLERFFSRGVPQQRIEDAADHGSTAEQQDVLRERSAVILKRLERRQAEVKRAAAETELAAAEAAEMQAVQGAKREAEQGASAQAAEGKAVEDAATPDYEMNASEEEAESVPDSVDDAGSDTMTRDEPDPGETAAMSTGGSESLFAETGPLREDMREANAVTPETADFSEPDAGRNELAAGGPEEDEDVAEQLRLKAEEAKARIAKRLESLEAAGEDAPPRLELGQDVPAIYPDEED